MKKLVLAYSGGLDTSYCVKYLSENGYEVHAVAVNTGGFNKDEQKHLSEKAMKMGAFTAQTIDAVDVFYEKVVKYLVFGNVLRNQTYPLSVSAERIVQALEIVKYARKVNAKAIAHGSTGAGNDQVRFDMIFQILAPDIEIITPVRDQKLSREEEIEYLNQKGIKTTWEKAKYSINKGLWGTSVGGAETLSSHLPLPEEAYPSQLSAQNPQPLCLTFHKGELIKINGEEGSPAQLIQKLYELASPYAIGRDIHTGDTIVGIKGRVGFEAAAPLLIIKAHHALEKHVLTKWQQQHKEYLSNWYGTLLHEGQYLDEVMRNIEAFLTDTQNNVTGEVYLTLHPYRFTVDGIQSPYDLMNAAYGSYGETNSGWTSDEAKGFIKLLATQNTIHHHINS